MDKYNRTYPVNDKDFHKDSHLKEYFYNTETQQVESRYIQYDWGDNYEAAYMFYTGFIVTGIILSLLFFGTLIVGVVSTIIEYRKEKRNEKVDKEQ